MGQAIKLNLNEYNAIMQNRQEMINEYNSVLVEAYEELLEEDYSYLEEGANLESRAKFKQFKKDFRSESKNFKEAFKAKDKEGCQEAIDNMNSLLSDVESEIKSCKSDLGSVILGYFAAYIMSLGDILIPTVNYVGSFGSSSTGKKAAELAVGVGTYIPGPIGTVTGIIKSLTSAVKSIKQLIEDIKEGSGAANFFNAYRGKILIYVKDYKKSLKSLEKIVNKM